MLQEGAVVSFLYPAANYQGVKPRWERRRVRVDAIRDFQAKPLDETTLKAEPLLNRAGELVTGYDLDKGAERSFYAGVMREVEVCPMDETYSVVWVRDADGGTFPDAYEIEGVCVEGVSEVVASVIADGGNNFLQCVGDDSRRLAVIDWELPKCA